MKRSLQSLLIGTAALLCGLTGAAAQTSYPSKPVKLVVPFAPGGGTDVIARALGKSLGDSLGVQFVIENKSGAGGVVGTDAVAKSPADGYTLLFAPSSHVVNPAVMKKMPYATESFEPISLVASATVLLASSAKVTTAPTLKDFLADAERHKDRLLNYGSSGMGTPFHLISEQFKRATGLTMEHVPYRGGSPAAAALVSGEIPILFETAITLKPFIQSGQVRPYAVMGTERSPLFPTVPTIVELGYRDLVFSNDYAVYAPAGTPQDIVKKLSGAIAAALQQPSMAGILSAQGTAAVGSTPEQLREYVKRETKRWKTTAEVAKITLD